MSGPERRGSSLSSVAGIFNQTWIMNRPSCKATAGLTGPELHSEYKRKKISKINVSQYNNACGNEYLDLCVPALTFVEQGTSSELLY